MPREQLYKGRVHSGLLSGAASADGATVARMWLLNHVGASNLVRVKKVSVGLVGPAAASTANTRVTAERMTFTGTPTGTELSVADIDTTKSKPTHVSARSASTGITPTAGAVVGSTMLGYALGTPTDAALPSNLVIYEAAEGEGLVLRGGEGLAIRQADAGDTDQKFTVDIDFEVYNK